MEQAQTESAHKNSHLWMIATIVVVLLAAVGVGVYWYKIRSVQTQQTSQAPTSQAKQISEELKQLDLAEIKASISEVQSMLGAL